MILISILLIDLSRRSWGFHNPNHAAALLCALVPLCWGWRRWAWVGRTLAGVLFAAVLLTQSRTGLLVLALEAAALWSWAARRGGAGAPRRKSALAAFAAAGALALWWLGPRLALDGSVLNRPNIWLAGLRLFAANPDGVGLGNSGALASAFLLGDVPEVRTLVSAHLTLLAEFGWLAGWAWLAFVALALCGARRSPRVGVAFAGLVLSACASTVFDWPVLFDFAERGGLGTPNWALSWTLFALFIGFGAWLAAKAAAGRAALPRVVGSAAVAGALVAALRLVPAGNAPKVRGGYAVRGEAPRTLALYDGSWRLKTVAGRVAGGAVLPVRGLSRFPRGLDWNGIGRVELFGTCREWAHLVKGVPVSCAGD
ncbi:MAG: O-antigen ligase family protein [Kiritimatiellia bacterium]